MPQIRPLRRGQRRGQYDIPIIADGGIKYSGDVVKALERPEQARSCSAPHVGGLARNPPGDFPRSSRQAVKVYPRNGSLSRHGQGKQGPLLSGGSKNWFEVRARVPYRGMLADTIYQIVGGLRSGMGYCGCGTIRELHAKRVFCPNTGAGLKSECTHHDIYSHKRGPDLYSRQPVKSGLLQAGIRFAGARFFHEKIIIPRHNINGLTWLMNYSYNVIRLGKKQYTFMWLA